MTAEPENCDRCHYQRGGVCRRMPPVMRDSGQLGGLPTACWPIVKPGDWCGEYRRRLSSGDVAEMVRQACAPMPILRDLVFREVEHDGIYRWEPTTKIPLSDPT